MAVRLTDGLRFQRGFRTYLGVTPQVSNWGPAGDEFSLVFETNPLTEFVEMPASEPQRSLRFSQIICGVLRGALEMVHMEVVSCFVQDQSRGDATTELRVKLVRKLEESVPVGED